MQARLRSSLILALLLGVVAVLSAQVPGKSTHKAVSWKEYCQAEQGVCFRYPAGWSVLGEVFDGNGVVVAPPQKQERTQWDEVTVALVVPPPNAGEKAVNIDQAIAQAVTAVRQSGQNFDTERRQSRTVDAMPAELVKLRYTDNETARDWIEELVFVEGPDSEIYSVALKCAPSSLAQMEPLFSRIVDSWRLQSAAPEPEAGGKTPERTRPKPESATPPKS